jgi:hypothetical protein
MNKIFKIGELPNYFKGSFNDVSFEVINQFDIYNKVDCIIQDLNTGKKIIVLNEKSDPVKETEKFIIYLNKNLDENITLTQERNVKKFVLDIIREIKSNNRKNKKNEFPIKKAALVKKAAPVKKQSGSSNKKYDKLYQALPVGKRTSASGKVYYESRENRSDKGVLLGVNDNNLVLLKKDILQDLAYSTKQVLIYENIVTIAKAGIQLNKEPKNKLKLQKQLKVINEYLSEMKEHIYQLKKLI